MNVCAGLLEAYAYVHMFEGHVFSRARSESMILCSKAMPMSMLKGRTLSNNHNHEDKLKDLIHEPCRNLSDLIEASRTFSLDLLELLRP